MLKTASAKEHGELALPKPDTSLLDLPGEQATVVPVAGAWTVTFPHAFAPNALADGAPETVTFEALADWTARPEEGVKYSRARPRTRKRSRWRADPPRASGCSSTSATSRTSPT